ncbi:uncharacterized protein LOC110465555 [Mizuhopecten yessoensis]|uniref:Uncharacterized protein n=1 Tax=Mizuhopecten yessoensis TaxID=6573 RepID=A0A210PRB2_MIZYE|nr:uncharacterized protein LOC110465555 [Mizuhopecten yessoensis]OWF39035.1 hypothetical protein KP79_PYT15141 [Mizuhopecten yessoensis]
MNISLLAEPKQEDEDEDAYLLPFGKISQRARRFDELESQKCNQTCKEDENYLSQDLFHSQFEIPPSDAIDRLSRCSPSTDLDKYKKTKKDISTNFIELPPTAVNTQQSLIPGYQVVKVCRGAGISSVTESNTFEALPHPTKLFRRRKQQASVTKTSQRSLRVQPHDKDNQSVAIHLRQLRLKQSRIDANTELDPNDLQRSVTNPHTAVMTQRTTIEKPITTTNISDWETIESWIHGRWKSRSGQHLNWHVQEE